MFLVELVKDLIISLVWWVILFPIVYLTVTPFILIFAVFEKEPFLEICAEQVSAGYALLGG